MRGFVWSHQFSGGASVNRAVQIAQLISPRDRASPGQNGLRLLSHPVHRRHWEEDWHGGVSWWRQPGGGGVGLYPSPTHSCSWETWVSHKTSLGLIASLRKVEINVIVLTAAIAGLLQVH